MACKKEGVPFSGTPEQEAALKKVITELKDPKGALMPIMQQAQDIYGYLPIEVPAYAPAYAADSGQRRGFLIVVAALILQS